MYRILAFHNSRVLDRQFLLSEGETYVLGRASACEFVADWDDLISRHHVQLHAESDSLRLVRCPSASNPVFVDGEEVTESVLHVGQSFVIGKTRFELQQVTQTDSPRSSSVQQLSIDRRQLQNVRYDDADKRIEVLASLPSVIRESGIERDLFVRLASLLLAGIRNADAVAIVVQEGDSDRPRIVHQELRFDADGSVRPSMRLIRNTLLQNRTIVHVWEEDSDIDPSYTQHSGFNWAYCTPFEISRGNQLQARHCAFYITGRSPSDGARVNQRRIQADVKFTEFIAEIVNSLQRQRDLERQQAGLRQFFSPPVLEALGKDLDTSLLEPRECDVTVLFCDLRGFSQQAEEQADDLTGLLERVSLALEVMTSQILRFGGVTGDFQGDAALGFWGWPISTKEAPLNACRAALAIREEFARAQTDPNSPLADFETSIGIAHGRAVAGKIGTREQVKVTVFGPVVNLASRLEGMTRQLHVPILIDEFLDNVVRQSGKDFEGRVRRLLKVLPYGMDNPLVVSELVPPEGAPGSGLTNEHLAAFERAVQAFIDGDWTTAWQDLHKMPAEDRAQDFLSLQITQNERKAPPDWDGIVRLRKKS